MITPRALPVLAALTVAAVLSPAQAMQPWSTDTRSGDVTVTMPANARYFTTPALITHPFTILSAQPKLITGRINVTRLYTAANVSTSVQIKCFDGSGVLLGNTRALRGTNPPAGGIQTPITYYWLFQPSAAGSYSCSLYASVSIENAQPTATPVVKVFASGTFLSYTTNDETGAGQALPDDCASTDTTGSCLYVSGGSSATALYGSGAPGLGAWRSSVTATAVDVIADAGLTNCDAGDACYPTKRGTNTSSSYQARIQIHQLDDSGHLCTAAPTYGEWTAPRTITWSTHHALVQLRKPSTPIVTTGACATGPATGHRFAIKLEIKHVSGNAIRIDGKYIDLSGTNVVVTNGVIMNL